jgi:hypothetical protein
MFLVDMLMLDVGVALLGDPEITDVLGGYVDVGCRGRTLGDPDI